MTELADTSAWTNRRKDPAISRDFESRLLAGELATCAMVKLELLWESQDVAAFRRRRDQLDALDEIPIDAAAWTRAIDIFEQLAARAPLHHRQVKLPDLLIAAAAENAGIPVCHYDRDFEVIAEVTGQAVREIAALGSL
jgi:predicted nucleic acid-binding protein